MIKKLLWIVVLVLVACSQAEMPIDDPLGFNEVKLEKGDAEFASATDLFLEKSNDQKVEDTGTVYRLLSDDNEGSRHQRFLVRLTDSQTLLIAHNIDLAPRIKDLQIGDEVQFRGEYVYNEKGGIIHWTHLDPEGEHFAGWVKHNGKTYQ
jgi:hypothetical protein